MQLELGTEYSFDITHRALVMGILNRTPDSFFDGGQYWEFDDFLRKAEDLVDQGADFLDVGGVKAGPGPEVTPQEELERVVPAVEALRERFDIAISVDTFRASVAEACYQAGACIGNDISGFADPEFLPAAARHDASVVSTHVRLAPRVPDPEPIYDDVRAEVVAFLLRRAEMAEAAGIPKQRIMIDAGLDLGKTPEMSTLLLRHSDDLTGHGYPVFLSASNKGFLGIALGCRILRAHDVRGARRLADTMVAILEARAA